jgi:hypothetical protein
MTYNQLVKRLQTLLDSHGQIRKVYNATPTEIPQPWGEVELPAVFFVVNTGVFLPGNERQRVVQMWFMDKSGQENEFEQDVSSDMEQVAGDVIESLYNDGNPWRMDEQVSYEFFRGEYGDFVSGVQLTFNIYTINAADACDMPLKA